ncbi:MAG: AAA family ATPase, partial [Candidatus Woesearchaeota archaeon]
MAKYSNCPKSYETFQKFINQCLIKNNSLIWPDEEVWTLKNLKRIETNFIDKPIMGGEFWDKLFQQFKALNDGCWRILADSLLVYTLPSTYMKPEKKYEYIEKVCKKRGFDLPDFSDERWDVLNQGFTRTSMRYHQKYRQLWLIYYFAMRVKNKSNKEEFINDHRRVRKELYDILENEIEENVDKAYGMLNSILHLGYPEKYERIISQTHKNKIIDRFSHLIDDETKKEGNIDEKISSIRESLEKEYEEKDFDFYLPSIQDMWKEKSDDTKNIETEEDPTLDNLVRTLRRHKQIILYGPPGTGKTYYAKKLANEVIAQDNFEKDFKQLNENEKLQLKIGYQPNKNNDENSYLRFCTFHPAYGYEEFIEGYRP